MYENNIEVNKYMKLFNFRGGECMKLFNYGGKCMKLFNHRAESM